MNEPQVLIRLQNLRISFGENTVVSDVSMELKQGQITTLIGPNGQVKRLWLKPY